MIKKDKSCMWRCGVSFCNIKVSFYLLLCVFSSLNFLSLSSCTKYDDSVIRSDINDLSKRIETLEKFCSKYNNNISSLQYLVTAFESGYMITGFETLYEGNQTLGYSISFSNGKSIIIYNGKDGKDAVAPKLKIGTDGFWYISTDGGSSWSVLQKATGEPGMDGLTPLISIARDETDGNWYWTLNGEWLLDANNQRVRANGIDGKDGTDGLSALISIARDETDGNWYWTLNGEWLLDANNQRVRANGIDGKDGTDGLPPLISITQDETDGNWYWTLNGEWLLDANNQRVRANGVDGIDGKDSDSVFEDIYCLGDIVFFVLKGGDTIALRANLPEEVDALRDDIYVERYDGIGNAEFWLNGVGVHSDMTWVGNTLVGFDAQVGESQDPSTENPSRMWLYTFSDNLQSTPVVRECFHMFGHCNTVDYNKYNDCLILGNGSGSYSLTGNIIIIPNFSTIVETEQELDEFTLASVNALVIHCTSELGTKFNLVWGDDNDKNYNIAYLITANYGGSTSANGGDLETIRKIVLRKGEEQGAYGTIVENSTPFNGTFDVVETYNQVTAGYANCDQGTCYNKGELFACIGHDGAWYWRMRMSNGKVYRKEYKQNSYSEPLYTNYGNSSGICTKDGYLFMGRSGLGVMAIRL